MNLITFSITRKTVHERLFVTSANLVRVREAMGIPPEVCERLLITDDNKELIAPLLEDSISEIFTEIVRYHSNCTVGFFKDEKDKNEDYYIFNLRAPVNYPTSNQKKLEQRVQNFVNNRILQSWYTNIKPDEASTFALNAQNDIAVLQAMLAQRSSPIEKL